MTGHVQMCFNKRMTNKIGGTNGRELNLKSNVVGKDRQGSNILKKGKTMKKSTTKTTKATAPKKAVKEEAPFMTSREKLLKFCEITKEDNLKGDVLTCDGRRHRMNRTIDELLDQDCDRIFDILKVQSFIDQGARKEAKKKANKAAKVTRVQKEAKPCECGCGAMAKPGSKFLPGHDMKLKSALRKDYHTGNAKAKEKANNELTKRGWSVGVTPKSKRPDTSKMASTKKVSIKKAV